MTQHDAKDPPEDLIDTVKTPDPDVDPAKEIEENGEPFEGNNA